MAKKLNSRGYSVIHTPTFEMPRNFYLDKYAPTPEPIQEKQFREAAANIIHSVAQLDHTTPVIIKESVFMIDLLADLFSLMAKSLGKNFNIDETCIACGTCESNCPKQNISYKDKKYSNRCILCTRCIHNCPVNAITYKGKKIEPYRVQHEITL
ncbi:MAG: EFR1 family ferrodoxin [Bacillota bacterium]|nr:EFR1 family ferrodoxin [Bacillota bacterium]